MKAVRDEDSHGFEVRLLTCMIKDVIMHDKEIFVDRFLDGESPHSGRTSNVGRKNAVRKVDARQSQLLCAELEWLAEWPVCQHLRD